MSQKNNTLLYTWNFSSEKNRWKNWYTIALAMIIWLVVWWFLTKQYWMSIVILIISGLYLFMENNSSDNVIVNINELWIKINAEFYDFSRIWSYCFIYEWENSILLRLNLKNKWLSRIDLKVDNKITSNLKNLLPNFIEENPKEDLSFSDKVIKKLKL